MLRAGRNMAKLVYLCHALSLSQDGAPFDFCLFEWRRLDFLSSRTANLYRFFFILWRRQRAKEYVVAPADVLPPAHQKSKQNTGYIRNRPGSWRTSCRCSITNINKYDDNQCLSFLISISIQFPFRKCLYVLYSRMFSNRSIIFCCLKMTTSIRDILKYFLSLLLPGIGLPTTWPQVVAALNNFR